MLLFNFYASMQMCAFDKLGEKVGLELYANVKRQLLQLHSEFQLAATLPSEFQLAATMLCLQTLQTR